MEPTAVVFSGPSFLSFNLVGNLLAKHCSVVVVTKEREGWKKFLTSQTKLLRVVSFDEELPRADYCFVIEGVEPRNKQLNKDEREKAFAFITAQDAKTLVVLPYVNRSDIENASANILDYFLKNSSLNLSLVYVGEIYGFGMSIASLDFVASLLAGVAGGRILVPSYDFVVFPVYINSLVEYLVRGVLSYGFEKRRFVVAERISVYDFLRKLQKAAPWVIIERQAGGRKPTTVPVFDFVSFGITDESIADTVNWVRTLAKPLEPLPVMKKPKLRTRKKIKLPSFQLAKQVRPRVVFRKRVLIVSFLLILWVLSMPFFSVFASGVAIKYAYNSFLASDSAKTEKFLDVSSFLAGFAKGQLGVFRKAPLIGAVFNFPYNVSSTLQDSIKLGKSGLSTYSEASQVFKGLVTDKDYNLSTLSEKIFLALDAIYKDSSFLETEIRDLGSLPIEVFPQIKNFDTARGYVLGAANIAHRLPVLLGSDGKKTYLVLFQNNMELRPTGGFIGSFALITFDKGKLIDTSVFDIYEADGQLKGHIEPPAPIKNFLGEANWWFRDSNWDPDFKTSAQRAEWFLEKEFDREVDGVIAVDLQVARELLKQTGPLNLSDVSMTVDYKNMYEKVQHEVESKFFPGSQRKSTILTSLENALLNKLPDLVASPRLAISLITLLREKHIQVFLHDRDSQNAVESVGFDGKVDPGGCQGNCSNLWLGLVEANLGVNKVNYYVTRDMKLTVDVKPTNIESKLTVKITNSSPASSDLSGIYKNYMRVLAPSKSYFDKVTTIGNNGTALVVPDTTSINGHVEVGVLVAIAPGETKTVVFSWNSAQTADFSKSGEVSFYLRKQAGIDSFPFSMTIDLPSGRAYFVGPESSFALTRSNEVGYNTNLTTDISGRIFWK